MGSVTSSVDGSGASVCGSVTASVSAAAVSDSLSAVFSGFLLAFFPFLDVVLTAAVFVSSASKDCVPVVCVM